MAKRDWRKLLARYERANHKKKTSIKEWAERNKLPYSQVRKNFSMIRAQMREEIAQIADQNRNSQDHGSDQETSSLTPNESGKNGAKSGVRTDVPLKGGQIGNTNALIHGIYQELYGDLWAASKEFSRELRYMSLCAKMLRADSKALEYQKAANEIELSIFTDQRQATDEEMERLLELDKKVESCLVASSVANTSIESMDNNEVNRQATWLAMEKMRIEMKRNNAQIRKLNAEAIHRERLNEDAGGDIEQRKLQIELLQANIEKTRRQSQLTERQIKELDGSGQDHDDIDDLFDEIMGERDGLMSDIPEDI